MFGYDPCWWYGLTVFLIFVGLNVLVWLLRNKPRTSYALAWLLAAYLFIIKLYGYVRNQAIGEHLDFPVEFSALSYFAYAISVLFLGRRAGHYGVFCGILAGLVYSAASWLSPSNFAAEQGMRYLLTSGFINHHLLYLGGMLMLANCRCYPPKRTWWHMLIGVGVFVGYSWLIHLTTPYSEVRGKPLIIRICDGDILLRVFSADAINVGLRIGYYIFAIGGLCALLAGFYLLNHILAKRRETRGLPIDYYATDRAIFRNLVDEWRRPAHEADSDASLPPIRN